MHDLSPAAPGRARRLRPARQGRIWTAGQGRIWSAKHRAYRAFQTRGIPIRNEQGAIEEGVGALTDVQDTIDIKVLLERTQTDLAKSLTELRLSEAKARAHLAE